MSEQHCETTQHTPILFGKAKVGACAKGWILPGCHITASRAVAERAAREIDRLIKGQPNG